ncbi:MAG: helix-turn-helix domain-containing protein, partial [bacterium]|nr:helix-turn-helix domain-containing protein [bacterium]
CHVDIKDPSKPSPSNPAGKFRGWVFDDGVPEGMQTTYDHIPGSPTQGYILISSTHPINKQYFGDDPSKDIVDSSRLAQLYLAELILNESLGAMVGEAYQKGIIQPTYGPAIDIPFYIAQKKFELGPKVYGYIAASVPTRSVTKRGEKLVAAQQARGVGENDLLDTLEGRSRELVTMYFGLDEERPHTLEEIATKVGVTRERVRQIINKALAPKTPKLQRPQDGIEGELADQIDDAWIDYIQQEEKKIASASERIVDTTASVFDISTEYMKERTRRTDVAIPRQVAIYLLRKVLNLSYPSIGRIFGFDHTTVIYASKKVEAVIKKDKLMAKRVARIEKLIGPVEGLITLQKEPG